MATGQVWVSCRRGMSLASVGSRPISLFVQPAAGSLYRIHRPASWHRPCKCRNNLILLKEGSFCGRVHGSDSVSRQMYNMAR